jgi:hypothetical protein
MKKQRLFLFLIFIWIVIICSCRTMKKVNIQNSEFSSVEQTLRRDLPVILEKIPAGYELLYGFRNRDEFQKAEPGKPFNYFSYNGSGLEKSSTISVPVIVENEYRALASMDYIKDTLHIVDFGANGLAKEIQLVQNKNSSLFFVGLLRLYRISSDFAIMSQNQDYLFFPLSSAKIYLQSIGVSKIENYYNQDQILKIIKEIKHE